MVSLESNVRDRVNKLGFASLNNLSRLWDVRVVPSCLVTSLGVTKTSNSSSECNISIKEVVGSRDSEFFGLHLKGIVSSEFLIISKIG